MITVDVRERKALACMQTLAPEGMQVAAASLPLGDFRVSAIRDDQTSHVLTVERKTVDDLVASVKDGRWLEQKCRLRASGERFAYVIEGRLDPDCAILWGCLVAIVRDGTACFTSRNVEETCRFVVETCKRVDKFTDAKEPASLETMHERALCRPASNKRNATIGPRQVLLSMLAAIPMVSVKTAERIVGELGVGDVASFVRALDVDPLPKLRAVPGVGPKVATRILAAIAQPLVADPAFFCGNDNTDSGQ